MRDPFNTRGGLTLCVGSAYLSSFELCSLKTGDVVRTVQPAGHSQAVLFNGSEIGRGEVVIVDDLICVRIVTTNYPRHLLPDPGRKDELVELLPALVTLGSVELSLAELRGAGDGTIISLGRRFSKDEDAELSIAGMTVAWGKVVVLGEEMGIRLTRVEVGEFHETNIRTSGYLLSRDEAARSTKDYDFRKPDRFSRTTIMKIAAIHDSFLRILKIKQTELETILVPAEKGLYVDQMTYGEALGEIRGRGEYSLLAAENVTRRRLLEGAVSWGPADRPPGWRALIDAPTSLHPVPSPARQFLEGYMDSRGMMGGRIVMIYYRSEGVFGKTGSTERGREDLLSSLRGGWKNLADLNFRVSPPSPAGATVEQEPGVHENEMVVTVMFSNRQTGRLELILLYPYLTLEPYLGLLG